jgi:hypothetical protein
MAIHNAWTNEEADFLRENWGKLSIHQIAKKLGRSPNGVIVKSKRINAGPLHQDYLFNKRELCQLLGIDHRKIDSWVESNLLKAKIAKTAREKGKSKGILQVHPQDLMAFLEQHQDLWDSRKAGDIYKAVRHKKWLEELASIRTDIPKREIPEYLQTTFWSFVADVAEEASERIKATRAMPKWLKDKIERDRGICLEREGFRWSEEDDRQLRSLFRNGNLSYREIGSLMGRSTESVEHRVTRIDIWKGKTV